MMPRSILTGLLQSIVTAILCIQVSACSTPAAVLKSNSPANLIKLDDKFKILARLGPLPYELKDPENIERFAVTIPGRSPEYLVVVLPKFADGEINLVAKETTGGIKSAYQYNRYLDLILRGHRHILRGELAKAKNILSEADRLYDETYASMVLQANIAIVENRLEDARANLVTAKALLPDSKAIEEIFK